MQKTTLSRSYFQGKNFLADLLEYLHSLGHLFERHVAAGSRESEKMAPLDSGLGDVKPTVVVDFLVEELVQFVGDDVLVVMLLLVWLQLHSFQFQILDKHKQTT